jgi:hypothetical protein
MFKLCIISIVVVPILLGMVTARIRNRHHAWAALVSLVVAYDLVYVALLYYLRFRLIG